MAVLLKHISTPLGQMTAASDGEALTGLWFDGQRYDRRGVPSDARWGECKVLTETENWLSCYFSGIRPNQMPPMRPDGTEFQRQVWSLLPEIPAGETVTYGTLARALQVRRGGQPQSPRAVGSAVGRNPISILIPCHRVIGANGSMTGYAGGIWRKEALLRLEQK